MDTSVPRDHTLAVPAERPRNVTRPSGTGPAESVVGDLGSVVAALRDQESFDRAQLAWLMAEAFRWGRESAENEPAPGTYRAGFEAGYNARVAEENGCYPPPKVLVLGRWYDQAVERAKADAAAWLPRPGDFKGVGSDGRVAA